MNEPASLPEIARLQKRRRRYGRMTWVSLAGVVTLAFTPALFSETLAFALYGIALFGSSAWAANALHARTLRHLSRIHT